ncbi:MAG: hypothetical protein J1E65_08580 [Lachnospiraceae bacterium]|nr:hypothetical protein [Lachnospiraceae bacterium]
MGTSEDQADNIEQVSYTNVGVIDPVDNKDFEMQDWQEAYAAYIEEEDKDGYYTYSLIYVNGDDIPELVIDTGGEAGGCEILTFYNGEMASRLRTGEVLSAKHRYELFDDLADMMFWVGSDGYDWLTYRMIVYHFH